MIFLTFHKNKLYQILDITKHTETGEEIVICPLYGDFKIYPRTYDMFSSEVNQNSNIELPEV